METKTLFTKYRSRRLRFPRYKVIVNDLNEVLSVENFLLVFDNSCEEIFNDKEFHKVETAGRHRSIRVIYVKHNLFQQSKCSRTIDLNTTHIIFFKSPRYMQQITYIGKQLNNSRFFKESYGLATKSPFGQLLIDLEPKF